MFPSLIKQVWKALLAAATIIGLLYLPADINGLPALLQPPVAYVAHNVGLLDRQTALVMLATILAAYILWIDARPLLSRTFAKKRITPALSGTFFYDFPLLSTSIAIEAVFLNRGASDLYITDPRLEFVAYRDEGGDVGTRVEEKLASLSSQSVSTRHVSKLGFSGPVQLGNSKCFATCAQLKESIVNGGAAQGMLRVPANAEVCATFKFTPPEIDADTNVSILILDLEISSALSGKTTALVPLMFLARLIMDGAGNGGKMFGPLSKGPMSLAQPNAPWMWSHPVQP